MITYTETIALFFFILGVELFKLELPVFGPEVRSCGSKVKMGSYLCTKYGVDNDLQYAT